MSPGRADSTAGGGQWPAVGRRSIPPNSFLKGQSVEYLGYRGGRQVWRSTTEKRLYTWDDLHGHVEAFNLRGRHVAVLDAVHGVMIGEAIAGRKINV
ncbi:colicin E3/pyocin S6 family cytotoxin [Actinomycetospora sp. NBRC 106378]|uniref:colicin E3/pyocin S6 family cytotoxin n=1 Tax=Actinomycetospora sp. NBRC 106378 TaxID=3032208 RepID=UPI003325BC64